MVATTAHETYGFVSRAEAARELAQAQIKWAEAKRPCPACGETQMSFVCSGDGMMSHVPSRMKGTDWFECDACKRTFKQVKGGPIVESDLWKVLRGIEGGVFIQP